MFRVPTYLAESSVHGLGVFTSKPLERGTIIWEFNAAIDWRVDPSLIDGLPEPYRSSFRSWCYLEDDGMLVLCGDNARFMNHSFEPNCDDATGPYTTTLRDIDVGEELTCDYRSFDLESAQSGLREWLSVPIMRRHG